MSYVPLTDDQLDAIDDMSPWDVNQLLLSYRALRRAYSELLIEHRQNGVIMSNVNDAVNRAGIHCAIYWWEAIDQIAGERDQLRADLDRVTGFVRDIADEDCSYGDECPRGTRHYVCLRCRADRHPRARRPEGGAVTCRDVAFI